MIYWLYGFLALVGVGAIVSFITGHRMRGIFLTVAAIVLAFILIAVQHFLDPAGWTEILKMLTPSN